MGFGVCVADFHPDLLCARGTMLGCLFYTFDFVPENQLKTYEICPHLAGHPTLVNIKKNKFWT